MANSLDTNGLQVDSVTDIVTSLTTSLQGIYGSDINVNQNSPDGQLINIFAQVVADLLELLVAVYNSFGVETAFGTALDQRVALNGITRNAGTYTQTPVNITVSQALNLIGQDQLASNPSAQVFTVSDSSGNQFQLVTSQTIVAAGTYTYTFQAVTIGAIQTLQNTITTQVTVVLGVTAVNNPAIASITGVNEETDAQLRVRHAQSFFLAASGPIDSIEAALLSLTGVIDALVLENDTGGTVNGIPAHSIWCITNGGAAADIGNVIYSKKAPGAGMLGSQSVVVTRPNGQTVTVNYDQAATENLWIRFTIVPKVANATFDHAAIATALVAALTYKVNQAATLGDPINAMLTIAPLAILTSVQVSTDGSNYFDIVQTTSPQYYFVLSTTRITIS